MSREPVCSSCGARLRNLERRCFQCGSRQPVLHESRAVATPEADVFVALAADEPPRIKRLLDRLVAAGIPFEPVGDLEADHADIDLEIGGSAPLVAVRVLRSELDRARAVEAEWMREAHGDLSGEIPLEGNAVEACPACGALLTRDAPRCTACGSEIPTVEESA